MYLLPTGQLQNAQTRAARYTTVEVLNLSEAARIALLQEMLGDAKRNERGGFITCIVGAVVSVAGFSTTSLASNSINLGVLGIAIAAVGFVVYLRYARLYSRLVGQLANIAFKSAVPCPKCGKALTEGEFDFCPFCGFALKSSPAATEVLAEEQSAPPISSC